MKTVYSFRIQGTMSKSVVNQISCSLYSMRLRLTKITWQREVFSGQRMILYRGQIINIFFFFFLTLGKRSILIPCMLNDSFIMRGENEQQFDQNAFVIRIISQPFTQPVSIIRHHTCHLLFSSRAFSLLNIILGWDVWH